MKSPFSTFRQERTLFIINANQGYALYEKNTNTALTISDFQTRLQRDFEAGQWIEQEDKQLIITSPDDEVIYTFLSDNINRQVLNISDDYPITTLDITSQFNNEPIEATPKNYLDALIIKVAFFDNEQLLFFNKKYSSLDLKLIAESE
jgi:hypothetical protein